MRLKTIYTVIMAVIAMQANAEIYPVSDSRIKDLSVERSENNLLVGFSLDLKNVKMKSDREMTVTPVIVNGDSTAMLPAIVVAGHNRYIQNLRKKHLKTGDILTRPGKSISYKAVIPYRDWMERAQIKLAEDRCGCGFKIESSNNVDLAQIDLSEKIFSPQPAYMTPTVETRKARSASGSAYIDFRVNRTEIDPGYRRNPDELETIRRTIDLIKNDPDSRIESITITGYASPEGPYDNNERLARGRTLSLADYVRGLYSFPSSTLQSAWVAEDWDGLKRYVENSDISCRDAILEIISDTSLQPDAREWRLKSKYPDQYRFLLENVYPGLRHSDYKVDYVISTFTDPAKIAAVLKEDPRKLSLHEMYVLAQSLPSDSDEFREVFEVAVRLYPNAPEANLNAALSALQFDDLSNAERYLTKAGDSPKAIYARGIFHAKKGDYAKAKELLEQAAWEGVSPQAADALQQLRAFGKIK